MSATVSIVPCKAYELEGVRQAVRDCLEPLGGMKRFVKLGMKVLLKPNLLMGAEREQAVTTDPRVVQAVAELVRAEGGEVFIADSPAGPVKGNESIWKKTGMTAAAEASGSTLLLLDGVFWREVEGSSYFIARPVLEADLVINLPKLKTHNLTLYSGAIKNMFGAIPGTRKREVHLRAPGIPAFSRELVNLLEVVKPGLTIMDGIVGQEGNGPGPSGAPHAYGILAASADPVALDAVMTDAMGFEPGAVLHVKLAGERGLGVAERSEIHVAGDPVLLDFGKLQLPRSPWIMKHIPEWLSGPVQDLTRVHPQVREAACTGCGKCAQVCPGLQVIQVGKPIHINLDHCIGCLCCAEVCPNAAIEPVCGPVARLLGLSN